MEYEIALPLVAVLLLLFDLVYFSRSKRRSSLNTGFFASAIAFFLMIATYGLLVSYFATDNFAVTEVYNYSSSSLPLVSKICASWAGAGGSVLFLALMITAAYFFQKVLTWKKPTTTTVNATQILCVITIFFILLDIAKTPFTRLDVVPPDGAGLNPALQSVWMNVHPPVVFVGYAFVLLAFSLSLGAMKSRRFEESKLLKVSTAFAWLLMTVGIAMGGVWAYEVLGWGGYWSWDPVETGSLLVWLALTAYFFVRPLAKSGKSLGKEFTLMVAFLALIFLSALTRGGLLQSVHAYALSPAGPILIGFAVGAALYFYYLQKKTGKPILHLDIDRKSPRSMSLAAGYFALVALFLGSFLGVAVPILGQLFTANPLTPGSSFYNTWSFPFTAIIVVAMMRYGIGDKIRTIRLAAIVVICAVFGLTFVAAGWPTANLFADLGMPLLTVGLVCVTYDLLVTIAGKGRRSLKMFGRKLLFFGMIVGLFGIMFSSAMKQTETLSNVEFNSSGVATTQALGTSIVLRNWSTMPGEGKVYSSEFNTTFFEHSSATVDVDIYDGESVYRESTQMFLYTNAGALAVPLLVHTLKGDFYLHLNIDDAIYNSLLQGLMGVEPTVPQGVSLTVSRVPFVYLLWAGVSIMCIGITLAAAGYLKKNDAEESTTTF